MSSHREAPEISKDQVADSTDVYAFVSPDKRDTVTLIASYLPFEEPASGPNFYEFGDDVLYEIHITTSEDAEADIIYAFQFTTEVRNPDTFLYNTGPINGLNSDNFNRRQTYTVTRRRRERSGSGRRMGRSAVIAKGLRVPPCNVGPRSTPNYEALAASAVYDLRGGGKVFAGQRADGFFVDLGAIFDLGTLRPFQNLHLIPTPAQDGVNALAQLNVHSIALQLPITELTGTRSAPTDVMDPDAVIGVWTTASRRKSLVRDERNGKTVQVGPWRQVSRLANPLFNEVLVPMGRKDEWNKSEPSDDAEYAGGVQRPELAALLPILYPTAFPNLAALDADRADLVAILLTGIPPGVVQGFQNTTGPTLADVMRLNVAVPPSDDPNPLGLIAGDAAGFPNGRRVFDDTVTVELRAIAGVTYPLVMPEYVPDGAAGVIEDGTAAQAPDYLGVFPYLGTPYAGYDVP